MDKKKLIGMFIGVLMFAALIAGATFAWLTIQANFTNNVITGSARDFTFTYEKGTDVSDMIWTTSSPPRSTIVKDKGYITIDVEKAPRIPEASSFKIRLKKDKMEVGVNDLIKYAVCRSDILNDGECNNEVATPIPTEVGGKWVALGSVTTAADDQILYDDPTTFNVYSETTPTKAHYFVYFWLDSAVLTNDNFDDAHGKQMVGYVYAEAEQGENGTIQ